MFTTSQPITLGQPTATQAFVSAQFNQSIVNGKIVSNVTFTAQRFVTHADGTVDLVGAPIVKAFPADVLAKARAVNGTLDSQCTAIVAALDALAPELGL